MTFMTKHIHPPLILASQSPRRKELLEQAGLSFTVVPSEINEDDMTLTEPEHYVRRLAEAKALDISTRFPDNWILGADTIVLSGQRILGKPASVDDARSMLKLLSGCTHDVLTGYCLALKNKGRIISETVRTRVLFKPLTDEEITWYVNTPEPYDKAGAYAIQGLGTFLVKRIEGSYTNVVGLPVCEVIETLSAEGALS